MASADRTLIPAQSDGDLNFPTVTDLSALQYKFVILNTSNQVVVCGANGKPLGILQNAPDGSSDQATAIVRLWGASKLKLAEAVLHGNFLTSTAAGLGEVADAANEEFGAVAIGAGDAGDLLAVNIQHGEVTASDA